MSTFRDVFQRDPSVRTEAPGRVNLIGEHTDYNGGFVLPTPIPQKTHVWLVADTDEWVRVASDHFPGNMQEYRLGAEAERENWLDYVQGMTLLLRQSGQPIRGFDAFIASEVPVGSGLSSSAALSVALLRAVRAAFRLTLDDMEIAHLARRIENAFVGANVGIMDPMVCSLGEPGSALFIDCRSLEHRRLPLPSAADLVVINSGVAHQHSSGDYNTRRAECEQACALLGVRQLRDVLLSDLPRVAALPDPLNRRARHVVTENARVQAAVVALEAGDLIQLGELFNASHDSQRLDYEVSVPAIDQLVELARADRDVFGARLTGGGFGGSIIVLARGDRGADVAARVTQRYAEQSGHHPTALVMSGERGLIEA